MSYVEDNLMPNEKVLFKARIHPAVFLPAVVLFLGWFVYAIIAVGLARNQSLGAPFAAIMFLCLNGIFIFITTIWIGFEAFILMLTSEFAVTNRRVIAKWGFIRRHTIEMLLQKVESVSVSQNILGRMLNFGTITITGTGGTREGFRSIVEPLAVRKKMYKVLEHYMKQAPSG